MVIENSVIYLLICWLTDANKGSATYFRLSSMSL